MKHSAAPIGFIRAIYFDADNADFVPVELLIPYDQTLPALQTLVGGNVEAIYPDCPVDPGLTMWMEDEARLHRKPQNHPATILAWPRYRYSMVGPAVVTSADHMGNTTGVSDEAVAWIREQLNDETEGDWPWDEAGHDVNQWLEACELYDHHEHPEGNVPG